jgi:hypothetical protein
MQKFGTWRVVSQETSKIRLYCGILKWITKDGENINTACIKTSAPAMEAEGDSGVVADSGAAETAEGATVAGLVVVSLAWS